MNKQPYYSLEVIDKTAMLIEERFGASPTYAKRLAIAALDGIESHGGDSTDWETVVDTVNVVVASWVENSA